MIPAQHVPVLLKETLEVLAPKPGDTVVDATVGLGNHSSAIAEMIEPNGTLIGIDCDRTMLDIAEKRLKSYNIKLILVHENFRSLKMILAQERVQGVDRALYDLGFNAAQIADPSRGIGFMTDGPLDMRLDQSNPIDASELLRRMTRIEIQDIIFRYGEERYAKSIAKKIVEMRDSGNMNRTSHLVSAVMSAVPGAYKRGKIHPATRTFQAIRIAVNHELDDLDKAITDGVDCLNPLGTLAVISFHSLEDRIVKHTFNKLAGKCTCPTHLPNCICGAKKIVEIITKKPLVPTENEMQNNPKSRSAKLRAVRKLACAPLQGE